MISAFSRMMDSAVGVHFKKDPRGRLVFIPVSLKGKCYFVDSKSDEEKIRALVKMYRSASTFLSFLTTPCLFVPAFILDAHAGMSPRAHRLAIALGIPLFFWLVLILSMWMLWSLYKGAIPSLTASLSEVGPETKGQLISSSRSPQRAVQLTLLVAFLLIVLALIAFLASSHFRVDASGRGHICQLAEILPSFTRSLAPIENFTLSRVMQLSRIE